MRIIYNLLLFCTLVFSYEFNIGLMGQLPKGEFKEQGVPTGFGIDFNGALYPADVLGIGLNIGYGQYGNASRQIQLSYFSDLVTVEEKTTNAIGYGNLFFKLTPFNKQWKVQPYLEGLIGAKHLSTKTKISNNQCWDDHDDDDDCEIASSTNASDWVFGYGVGFGIDVPLKKIDNPDTLKEGDMYFFINSRYLWGGEATYLKKGDIEHSDPEEGPVESTITWNTSSTDLLHIIIGLGYRF